jgi:site-specific recombinase XerD
MTSTDLARLEDVADRAREYVLHAKAPNTLRGYRADWSDFTRWCADRELASLPAAPETVALYLVDLAERCRVSTLQRRLSAIAQAHKAAGHESPTGHGAVSAVWSGIRRSKGTAQVGKAPALTADIRLMVAGLPDSLGGHRDRALLLIGFAGAFRRSELVGLDVGAIAFADDGLVLTLARSKTDQEGRGERIGIPYGSTPATCPVRALRRWLDASGIADGPLFRSVNRHGHVLGGRLSDQAVALVVKRAIARTGRDPAAYSGHSLRAGLATSAAAAGVSERAIAEQTRHKSLVILRRYIRHGSLFRENAAAAVGL